MKKTLIWLACFIVFLSSGCSKTASLSYGGSELLYNCTEEEIALFEGDVDVNIKSNQGFAYYDNYGDWHEYTNGIYSVNDDNRITVTKCYFIDRSVREGNSYTSKNIAFKDENEGSMKLVVSGDYSYKVYDSRTLVENYTDFDEINRKIVAQINAIYIMDNIQYKTYSELLETKEFTEDQLHSLNVSSVYQYGIEVTKVTTNISKVE